MAPPCNSPHCNRPRRRVEVVQGSQELLQRRRGQVRLVERHLVEEVVGNVGGSDLVVEVIEYAVVAVNGGQRACTSKN